MKSYLKHIHLLNASKIVIIVRVPILLLKGRCRFMKHRGRSDRQHRTIVSKVITPATDCSQ
jgi:hypothetical protein